MRPEVFRDHRGSILETFKGPGFIYGVTSRSLKGVVRGLHYQVAPFEQGKLIRVTRGKIFCVSVDLSTATIRHSELSDADETLVFIPPGFANGFQALENSEIQYLLTAYHNPEFERGIHYADPGLDIPWPLSKKIVSAKDEALPFLQRITV